MTHDTRLLRQLGLASLTFATTACGGGGSDAAASAPTTTASFSGTAYLKTSNTILYAGKTYGVNRDGGQGLVDQCNGFRASYYGLPAVLPAENTMASLDVQIYEKYFDTDKA